MPRTINQRLASLAAGVIVLIALTAWLMTRSSDATGESAAAVSALSDGRPAQLSTAEEARVDRLAPLGPDTEGIRRIASPVTGDAAATWLLVPAAKGRLCLVVQEGTGCGLLRDVRSGAFRMASRPARALTTDELSVLRRGDPLPADAPSPFDPGRDQVLRGIVPDGVDRVQAVDPGGRTLGSAPVVANAYELAVPNDGRFSHIVLVRS